jgi:phosphate transport system permease protein
VRRSVRRRWLDRAFWLACALCAAGVGVLLAGIAGAILWRGLPVLRPGFLTAASSEAGASGGVRDEIVGTLILITTALLVSAPLATGVALVHSVYLRSLPARRRLLVALYTANALPSILFGIAGMVVFSRFFGWGKSWLAGGLLLGLMILPTLSVALIERLRSLPRKYREAASALGLTRAQTVWSVLLPQCAGGLLSGALLGLARAAGETAPILFAAAVFSGAGFPSGLRDSPVAALPYHIFVLAQDSFDPAVESHLWGAACVLVGLVLGLSLMALPARLRAHEEARNA